VTEINMADALTEIEAKIGTLSAEEKVALIRALIADLDGPPDADVKRAWLEEAQRRYRDILEGKVKTIPADQVFENLQSRLKK
jgi:putative addiction module component (TIGR02574 family)